MAVGIIANPASGKDIRRLVSYATVIDNNEKVNIVKRAVCAAQAAGVKEVFMMPDSYQIGHAVKDALELEGKLQCKIDLLDMPISAMARDTVIAARKMEDMRVGCVIVLGGDGTSRAACKSLVNTPILPVSTGTNNVYPTMIEGTAAGLAAAAADLFPEVRSTFIKDKRIEVYDIDGRLLDIALVDAVISADIFIGTKAIWDMDKIRTVITALAHPAGIGFSTMVGCQTTVDPEDDFGMVVDVDKNKGQPVLAPVAAGTVQTASLTLPRKLHLEEPFLYQAEESCMIALDGEREVELKKGSSVIFKVTRQGPFRIDVRKTLEKARQAGMFSYAAAGR